MGRWASPEIVARALDGDESAVEEFNRGHLAGLLSACDDGDRRSRACGRRGPGNAA